MWENRYTTLNISAEACIWLAKISAWSAFFLGFYQEYRVLAGCLIGLAFAFIGISVTLCIKEMNRQNKIEESFKQQKDEEKELIVKMIENGSLIKQLNKVGYKLEKSGLYV